MLVGFAGINLPYYRGVTSTDSGVYFSILSPFKKRLQPVHNIMSG